MNRLSDDILKQIAEGTGRCYNHEGKAMAQELVAFRKAAAEAVKAAANAAPAQGGFWNGIP